MARMQIPRLKDITAQYREEHNPPGMWAGYHASLPLTDPLLYYPRVGLAGGIELSVDCDPATGKRWRPMTLEQVKPLARRLAWERYDMAAAKAIGDTISSRDFLQDT